VKLLVMLSFPAPCYLAAFRPKCLFQHPAIKVMNQICERSVLFQNWEELFIFKIFFFSDNYGNGHFTYQHCVA
jgi:hypothetical protein